MTRSKIFLLPLTARATLNAQIARAAAAAANAAAPHHRIAFRVARSSSGISTADEFLIQQLRSNQQQQQHDRGGSLLLAEESDFVVDFSKPRDVRVAMDGCDGVVVSTALTLSDPNAFAMEMNMVQAAQDVGSVQDVLKVSCAQGLLGEKSSVAIGAQHWEIEQCIKQAKFGGNVRFVRPNTLMDSLLLQGKLYEMICARSLSVSVKHGRVALVDPLDVADAIAVLLAKPANAMGLPEQYALSGPDALSFQEIADQLSAGIGQRVSYTYFPLWAVQPSMWIRGEKPEAIANEIQTARALEEGAENDVTTTVEDVLGRQPRSLQAFIQDHADAWPLRAYK